jgi:hypothetical protein
MSGSEQSASGPEYLKRRGWTPPDRYALMNGVRNWHHPRWGYEPPESAERFQRQRDVEMLDELLPVIAALLDEADQNSPATIGLTAAVRALSPATREAIRRMAKAGEQGKGATT